MFSSLLLMFISLLLAALIVLLGVGAAFSFWYLVKKYFLDT